MTSPASLRPTSHRSGLVQLPTRLPTSRLLISGIYKYGHCPFTRVRYLLPTRTEPNNGFSRSPRGHMRLHHRPVAPRRRLPHCKLRCSCAGRAVRTRTPGIGRGNPEPFPGKYETVPAAEISLPCLAAVSRREGSLMLWTVFRLLHMGHPSGSECYHWGRPSHVDQLRLLHRAQI